MASDKVTLMMQEVWKRAFKEGEVILELGTKADQVRARFMLYAVSKAVKRGPKGVDFDLEDAVAECMISVTGETQLTVRHKSALPLIQLIGSQLGIDPETLAPNGELEKEAAESLRRLQDKLDAPAADDGLPKFHNPYSAQMRKEE